MSEETEVYESTEATEETIVNETEEQAPVVDSSSDEIKKLARSMGWIDPANYKGDPEKFVDAETYVRRTQEINSDLRRKLKEITNVVSELKRHNELVYKAEIKRLEKEVETLMAQRKEAISDGDVDRVEKIEREILDLRETVDTKKQVASPSNVNPVWEEWLEKNPWYNDDEEMRDFADRQGREYEGLPFEKILKLVKRDVMDRFPNRFKSSSKQVAPTVESSKRPSSQRATKYSLTPEQRNIMAQFVRHGVMTEQEYINDLIKRGDL